MRAQSYEHGQTRKKKRGKVAAPRKGARSAIRETRARPPAQSHCAPIRPPCPHVPRRSHRRHEIVHQGSRSSQRRRAAGVVPRPCVLSSSSAVKKLSKPAAVMAKVMAKILGLKRPSLTKPVCPHRPHLHLHPHLHPRRHRHYPHLLLHRRPYLRPHPVERRRVRALSRAAYALQRSCSSRMPRKTRMTHQTNVSESDDTRERISPMAMMVTRGVTPIANLGGGCQPVSVAVLSRE